MEAAKGATNVRQFRNWTRFFCVTVLWAYGSSIGQPLRADWNQLQGNAGHSGYALGHVSFDPVPPQLAWSPSISGISPRDPSVALHDRFVFVNVWQSFDVTDVVALDRRSGNIVWRSSNNGQVYNYASAATLSNDRLLITATGDCPGGCRRLFIFDATTGATQAQPVYDDSFVVIGAPTVLDSHVYLSNYRYDPTQRAVSEYHEDGSLSWSRQIAYGALSTAADMNRVYALGADDFRPGRSVAFRLYGIDRNTGEVELDLPFSTTPLSDIPPTIILGGQDDAIFALQSEGIKSFDLITRAVRWSAPGLIYHAAAANGVVAATDCDDVVFLDQQTGAIMGRWTNVRPVCFSDIIMTDSHVFVSEIWESHYLPERGRTYAIDLVTHEMAWSIDNWGELAFDDGLLVISNPTALRAYTVIPEPTTIAISIPAVIIGAILAGWRCLSGSKFSA